MTYRDHDHGKKLFIIHIYHQPFHILPLARSYQLCHAVIKSHTIKPIKASKYSITFQMHEQKGTFNGLDPYSITNYYSFDS